MRQRPLLWIWDDLPPSSGPPYPQAWPRAGQQEMLAFLRSARDTKAKILLISRSDEQAWLGDLATRTALPPMSASESSLLMRAVAARNGINFVGLDPSSPALTATGGNPRAVIDLADRAFRAGCGTSDEVENFAAGTAIGQDV